MRAYRAVIERFIQEFGDGPVEQVTPEQILTFLNRLTEGNKPYTKRIRYSQISSFFELSPSYLLSRKEVFASFSQQSSQCITFRLLLKAGKKKFSIQYYD